MAKDSDRCHEHIPQVRQDHEAGDEDDDPQDGAGRQDKGFLQCHQPSSEMGPHGHCQGDDLSGVWPASTLLHPTLCCGPRIATLKNQRLVRTPSLAAGTQGWSSVFLWSPIPNFEA